MSDFAPGDRVIARGTVEQVGSKCTVVGWGRGRLWSFPNEALEPEPFWPAVGDEVEWQGCTYYVTNNHPQVTVYDNGQYHHAPVDELSPATPKPDVDAELLAAAEAVVYFHGESLPSCARLRAAIEAKKAAT